MTSSRQTPVSLELLVLNQLDLKTMGRISNPQIFDGNNNFHPDGLFSTTAFGAVGSAYRSKVFGYIELNCSIINPTVYNSLVSIKSLYEQIMKGKALVEWDPKLKDFVKSNSDKASTGYTYFMSKLEQIKFELTGADSRKFNVDLVNKAISEKKHTLKQLIVLPAGLRDYFVDQSGKPQEDEINAIYRKIINQTNLIDPLISSKSPESYDHIYTSTQDTVCSLYEYLKGLLDGKNKLVLGKWLSRKVFNSTRNVLSTHVEKGKTHTDPDRLKYNDCVCGLHQFCRVISPKSIYEIKNKYIKDIFIDNTNTARLVNAKTLKCEDVMTTSMQKDFDKWNSSDGLNKVIASLANIDMRHVPITLNGGKHYLALIYNDGKSFKVFHDIDDLPTGYDKSHVSPITLSELIYASLYHLSGSMPGFVTRYPIQGYGGIFPVFIKVRTTSESIPLEELNENWEPSGKVATMFPIRNVDFYNTLIIHPSHLALAGADFDGDVLSLTGLITNEAIAEITSTLKKRSYYISDNNEINFNSSVGPLNTVLNFING